MSYILPLLQPVLRRWENFYNFWNVNIFSSMNAISDHDLAEV